ncbi:MAG: YraN family protein [Candidatus Erginobacter occultus]|nr:YraN family protein [Candidatus Erginobacter occultus]
MTKARQDLGKWGEAAAVRHLEREGWEIVEQNYTCPRGEIDIVARQGERLVFVEVKTKTAAGHLPPRYSVNRRKQGQIIRVARWYLKEKKLSRPRCRFDVVEVIGSGAGLPEKLTHLPGAFRVGR